jgi:nucleoside-diphosphate kinase
MAKTLIILKPDCLENKHAGEVISRFEKEGFEIRACKMVQLSSAVLMDHYAHVADKPFFPEIEEFMSSRPVVVLVLEGENVIDRVRDLLGPTNSKVAEKGTIRGDMGTDMMRNIAHASDSPENAEAEIKRFFEAGEIF